MGGCARNLKGSPVLLIKTKKTKEQTKMVEAGATDDNNLGGGEISDPTVYDQNTEGKSDLFNEAHAL